jgi:acyl-CoA dehydrogenase
MAEITAASLPNKQEAIESFDEALLGHIGYAIQNGSRSLFHGLTKGFFAESPIAGVNAKYYRRLSRMSAAYSFLADIAMLFLGGGLKRKEMLSGRFADGLMHMYMASAVLKRFEDTGRPEADQPLLEWSVRRALFETQIALDQILRNFPNTAIGLVLRGIVFPLGRRYRTPNDRLTQQCARILLSDSAARDRLTAGAYLSDDPTDATGCIEYAFQTVLEADKAARKIRSARCKQPWDMDYQTWLQQLITDKIIDKAEAELLKTAETAAQRVIAVDDFPNDIAQGGSVTI